MSRFKRSQAKYVKQTHTITNWPAYDQALVTRGSLTFWFTDEAISQWTACASRIPHSLAESRAEATLRGA